MYHYPSNVPGRRAPILRALPIVLLAVLLVMLSAACAKPGESSPTSTQPAEEMPAPTDTTAPSATPQPTATETPLPTATATIPPFLPRLGKLE